MSDDFTWEVSGDAELEAGVDVAATLLATYDPQRGTWGQPRTGEFWDTVRDAHSQGLTGRGVTVAVIDGGFDVTVPALSGCTPDRDDPLHTAHGTVVALLLKEVAPECRLLLFTVTRDGRVDMDLVTAAIRRAVAEGADVINLSLGYKVVVPEEVRWASSATSFIDWRQLLELPPHPVSEAADEAAQAGVVVVAACGNKSESVLIPAAHHSAFAVGFLTVLELAPGELTGVAPTGYAQSRFADFQLVQPERVLGSSFASPQFAGFVALSPYRDTLRAYTESVAIAGYASDLMIGWSGSVWDDRAAAVDDWFNKALQALPHLHRAGADSCPTCALLAVPGYLNWGQWRLGWNDLDGAEPLFRAVTSFAPSNAKAKGNLAVTLASRAEGHDLPEEERAALYAEAAHLMAQAAAAAPTDPVLARKATEYSSAVVSLRP